MIRCTKTISFDAAHRIIGHEGKCKFLHGHRYVCEVTFASPELNDMGMVIDFGHIKDRLGKWIDEHFDHNLILAKADINLIKSLKSTTEQTIYLMEKTPTAENMALHILNDICPTLFQDEKAYCEKIRLYESANSYVEVFRTNK
ncbi:MAG: 6-carboxytetrahydropterin synthase [Rickettsiales bacterium]